MRPWSGQFLRDLYRVNGGIVPAKSAVADKIVRGYIKVPELKWVDISSPLAKRNPDAAYSYLVSGPAGLLVINEIHKDRDKNRPGQILQPPDWPGTHSCLELSKTAFYLQFYDTSSYHTWSTRTLKM